MSARLPLRLINGRLGLFTPQNFMKMKNNYSMHMMKCQRSASEIIFIVTRKGFNVTLCCGSKEVSQLVHNNSARFNTCANEDDGKIERLHI